MNRLRKAFDGDRRVLVAYITAGDPSLDATVEVIVAAAAAGADVVELGMPFSDPTADGAVIREAMQRALRGGVRARDVLDVVRRVRARDCQVPLLLFGYYNPVFAYGVDRFCAAAAEAGADGLLVVDLPIDEAEELGGPARKVGLELVPLVAPTSGDDRMQRVAALDPPFVYYVSMTGTTGGQLDGAALDEIEARVKHVRAQVGRPVAVGFGITTAADARRVAAFAEGVVVGSALVKAGAAAPGKEAAAIGRLVAELAAGVRA